MWSSSAKVVGMFGHLFSFHRVLQGPIGEQFVKNQSVLSHLRWILVPGRGQNNIGNLHHGQNDNS